MSSYDTPLEPGSQWLNRKSGKVGTLLRVVQDRNCRDVVVYTVGTSRNRIPVLSFRLRYAPVIDGEEPPARAFTAEPLCGAAAGRGRLTYCERVHGHAGNEHAGHDRRGAWTTWEDDQKRAERVGRGR